MRRASKRPNRVGFAVPTEHRLQVTAYPGIRPGDVLETLLHELVHLHVGRAREAHAWHGRTFKATLARAMEEAYGVSGVPTRSTLHGAYAEAIERLRAAPRWSSTWPSHPTLSFGSPLGYKGQGYPQERRRRPRRRPRRRRRRRGCPGRRPGPPPGRGREREADRVAEIDGGRGGGRLAERDAVVAGGEGEEAEGDVAAAGDPGEGAGRVSAASKPSAFRVGRVASSAPTPIAVRPAAIAEHRGCGRAGRVCGDAGTSPNLVPGAEPPRPSRSAGNHGGMAEGDTILRAKHRLADALHGRVDRGLRAQPARPRRRGRAPRRPHLGGRSMPTAST